MRYTIDTMRIPAETLRHGLFDMRGEYAKITCDVNGINIAFVENIENDGAFYFRNSNRDKTMKLPKRIMEYYGYREVENIYHIPNGCRINAESIPFDLSLFNPPKPYHTYNFEFSAPKEEDYLFIKQKTVHGGRVSLDHSEFGNSVIVKCMLGDRNCIILEPDRGQDVPSLAELKSEYGANLSFYPYDELCYRQTTKDGKELSTIIICFFAQKKLNIQNEDKVKYIRLRDGRVLIIPIPKTCAVDKEEINPVEEKAKNGHVCENCSSDLKNDGDMSQMIAMMRETMDLCNELMKKNKVLLNRIKELERTVYYQ